MFEDDALGHGLEPHLIVVEELLAGEDDDRQILQGGLRPKLLQQFKAVDVRQAEVEHDAVVRPAKQGVKRLAAGGDCCQFDVLIVEQLDNGLALMSLSSTTRSGLVRGAVKPPRRSRADLMPSVVGDLTR